MRKVMKVDGDIKSLPELRALPHCLRLVHFAYGLVFLSCAVGTHQHCKEGYSPHTTEHRAVLNAGRTAGTR